MKIIGDKNIVAFGIGDNIDQSDDMCYIDIWIANKHVTSYDNIAYLPAIISSVIDEQESQKRLNLFEIYFENLSIAEIHQFILNTRVFSCDSAPKDHEVFPEHQVFDWGPNTDHVISFLVNYKGSMYITLQFIGDVEERDDKDNVYYAAITWEYYYGVLNDFSKELKEKRVM